MEGNSATLVADAIESLRMTADYDMLASKACLCTKYAASTALTSQVMAHRDSSRRARRHGRELPVVAGSGSYGHEMQPIVEMVCVVPEVTH